MTDPVRLMRLQSWLSPAFPIGAYSYSHGLEWAVEAGQVRDRASLVDWLEADLRFGAGRSDGIFFAEAWRAAHSALPGADGATEAAQLARHPPGRPAEDGIAGIIPIAELAAAMRATSELALEASQQGVAFLSAVRKAWPHSLLDRLAADLRAAGVTLVLPVAAGVACAAHGITLGYALPLFLHAGVANLINAAVRLVPLGQTDGQMALAALESAVAETAAEALASGLSDIGSAALMIDIASMQHETQYTRLFRS
jgi:urease accessory protein